MRRGSIARHAHDLRDATRSRHIRETLSRSPNHQQIQKKTHVADQLATSACWSRNRRRRCGGHGHLHRIFIIICIINRRSRSRNRIITFANAQHRHDARWRRRRRLVLFCHQSRRSRCHRRQLIGVYGHFTDRLHAWRTHERRHGLWNGCWNPSTSHHRPTLWNATYCTQDTATVQTHPTTTHVWVSSWRRSTHDVQRRLSYLLLRSQTIFLPTILPLSLSLIPLPFCCNVHTCTRSQTSRKHLQTTQNATKKQCTRNLISPPSIALLIRFMYYGYTTWGRKLRVVQMRERIGRVGRTSCTVCLQLPSRDLPSSDAPLLL